MTGGSMTGGLTMTSGSMTGGSMTGGSMTGGEPPPTQLIVQPPPPPLAGGEAGGTGGPAAGESPGGDAGGTGGPAGAGGPEGSAGGTGGPAGTVGRTRAGFVTMMRPAAVGVSSGRSTTSPRTRGSSADTGGPNGRTVSVEMLPVSTKPTPRLEVDPPPAALGTLPRKPTDPEPSRPIRTINGSVGESGADTDAEGANEVGSERAVRCDCLEARVG